MPTQSQDISNRGIGTYGGTRTLSFVLLHKYDKELVQLLLLYILFLRQNATAVFVLLPYDLSIDGMTELCYNY